MKIECLNRSACGLKVRTFIIDAKTGRVQKKSGWSRNTVMDGGLNYLAQGYGFSGVFNKIGVGSSNTQNYTHNASVTFTQAGNTLTASGSFFTSGMVGQLFKYGNGTGGAEYYITGYTNALVVTVDTSASVTSAAQGTVWNVLQTSLVSPLYTTSTLFADAGNGTVIASAGVIQLACKFQFAVQGSPYSVNEISYQPNGTTNIAGRIVLSSTDVVPATSFYVVQAVMTFNVSPCAATVAYGNTGTGVNIAGTGIYCAYSFQGITATTGAQNTYQAAQGQYPTGLMDSGNCSVQAVTQTFTLPAATPTGAYPSLLSSYPLNHNSFTQSGTGISNSSNSFNVTTAGENCYGLHLGGYVGQGLYQYTREFELLFTTPVALPVGAFVGTYNWQNVFTRTLSNP